MQRLVSGRSWRIQLRLALAWQSAASCGWRGGIKSAGHQLSGGAVANKLARSANAHRIENNNQDGERNHGGQHRYQRS